MSEEEKKNKPWQTGNTIRLNTNHLILKTQRDYVFKEINQEWGSRIFWKYVIVIVEQWPKLKKEIEAVVKDFLNGKGGENFESLSDVIAKVFKIVPEIFTWENITEISQILLSDHEMYDGKKKYVADEKGFCGIGDPFEVYNAIFFAMCTNWPDYFSPLLEGALSDLTRDSEPEPTQNEAGKN